MDRLILPDEARKQVNGDRLVCTLLPWGLAVTQPTRSPKKTGVVVPSPAAREVEARSVDQDGSEAGKWTF